MSRRDTRLRAVSVTTAAASQMLSRRSGLLLDPDRCGYVIGIDFGEAHDRVVLADIHGCICKPEGGDFNSADYERRHPPGRDSKPPPEHFRWAGERIEDLLARAEVDAKEIWAVGVSLPGPVNKRTKRLQVVPENLDPSWNVIDIELPAKLRLPKPTVESDYNASALTEHLWGSLRDQRDALYVKVGQRCGCSLLINHRIYRGATGVAGRLGKTFAPSYAKDADKP